MSIEGGLLAGAGIEIFKQIQKTLIEIKEELPKPKPVVVVQQVDKFSFTEIGRASTTSGTRPKTPDLTFDNPRDIESVIKEISYTPDTAYKTQGMISVQVDDVEIYKNKAVADFTDVSDGVIPMPDGKTIKRNGTVKVFIWNGTDTDAVALTVQVTFSESVIFGD